MTDATKPEMLHDEAMDEIRGAATPKLMESVCNGKVFPATSAARETPPMDSFSINFAKIEVAPE